MSDQAKPLPPPRVVVETARWCDPSTCEDHYAHDGPGIVWDRRELPPFDVAAEAVAARDATSTERERGRGVSEESLKVFSGDHVVVVTDGSLIVARYEGAVIEVALDADQRRALARALDPAHYAAVEAVVAFQDVLRAKRLLEPLIDALKEATR